jgi:hypothetical protein
LDQETNLSLPASSGHERFCRAFAQVFQELKKEASMYRKLFLAGVAVVSLAFARPVTLGASSPNDDRLETFVVDVAIDAHTLGLNSDPTAAGIPRRGTTFIVNGKVYPGGTIPSGVTGFDPDSAPGSIGTWVCRGVFLADFADIFVTGSAALAFDTTQIFLLDSDSNAIFTEGMEGNVGVTTHRTVTGGTGRYRMVVGTLKQETIGVNRNAGSDGLFDLRFTFTVKRAE